MVSGTNLGWFLSVTIPLVVATLPLYGFVDGLSWLSVVVSGMVLAAAMTDTWTGRIPNYLTYAGVAWGLSVNCFPQIAGRIVPATLRGQLVVGDVGAASSLAGAAVCFAIMFVGYVMAGSGAGDVKLATALGALLGWQIALQCLMATFIMAGAAILVRMIWAEGPLVVGRVIASEAWRWIVPGYQPCHGPKEIRLLKGRVPLGAFFAAGTIFVLTGVV